MHDVPVFEICHEVDFVIGEAKRISTRYPKIPVAPPIYRVEDHLLYQVNESFSIPQPHPADAALHAP